MVRELGERHIAVVGTLEQGTNRRCLEKHMRLILTRELRVSDRLDVKRTGKALVDHAVSLSADGSCLADGW